VSKSENELAARVVEHPQERIGPRPLATVETLEIEPVGMPAVNVMRNQS